MHFLHHQMTSLNQRLNQSFFIYYTIGMIKPYLLPKKKECETMKHKSSVPFACADRRHVRAIPKSAWSRRYPSDETNGCVLAMRSLV